MRSLWMAITVSAMMCAPALFAATKTTTAPKNQAVATGEHTQAQLQRWPAENLKGTVSMVDPSMHLVVVRDSSGVPFDFKIAPSTRIDAGQQREQLSQLAPQQSVTVHFVPEAKGDIARTIQVGH